jgi:hypothetical protein
VAGQPTCGHRTASIIAAAVVAYVVYIYRERERETCTIARYKIE